MKDFLTALGYFDSLLSPLELRRQRAFTMTAIFLIVVLVADIYQHFNHGYYFHGTEELLMVLVVLTTYILQRLQRISRLLASRVMVFLIVFQMLFSFVTPGVGEEIMLFWIATLPLIIVLLIDLKEVTIVNVGVVAYLVGVLVSSQLQLFDTLFDTEVLLQVVAGYSLFTTLVYLIEKSRRDYEEDVMYRMREREVLLKEVHHRVKNNMQMMMSLLGLQASSIDEPKYAKLFLDNIDRLSAMSLVHESIYKAENFEKINMHNYLKDIVKNLQKMTRHTMEYNFSEVTLDMKTAMNLGLILNEAITNALEHAYEENDIGSISLELYEADKIVTMKIEDFGIGLSDVDSVKETLGFTLIHDLTHSLNEGTLQIYSNKGLKLIITCKVDADVS